MLNTDVELKRQPRLLIYSIRLLAHLYYVFMKFTVWGLLASFPYANQSTPALNASKAKYDEVIIVANVEFPSTV